MPEYMINGKIYIIERLYDDKGPSMLEGVIDYLIDLMENEEVEVVKEE